MLYLNCFSLVPISFHCGISNGVMSRLSRVVWADESSKAQTFTRPIQLWRRQVKLRYKFSHTSSDSSFWKHSLAYVPSHFAPLNYLATGKRVLWMITTLSVNLFFMQCIYKRISPTFVRRTSNDFLRIDYTKGFKSLLFEEDLMFAARGDGWNKKFNSFFYRLRLMLRLTSEEVEKLQGIP